jgi:hypothetical protein
MLIKRGVTMKIPKIKFRQMTLEENIETIKWAYYEDNGLLSVHYYTIKYFPELANIDKSLPQSEVYKIIEKVVKNDYSKYKTRIEEEVERYNLLWKKYNDLYFQTLSKYLDVEWPSDLDIIEGKVGLIPVFPRYLDSFSFAIATGVEEWKIIETCAHETLHFLWFEKWKNIHPETPRREYDSPYITWQYSEMVTDPILNNAPFADMFNFEEKGYDSFYEMYDGDTLVMDNLRKIYSENIPINKKINKGFDYLKSMSETKNKTK